MLCDHCHKNEATIHMTNIVNNQKTEQHLCGTCASKLQQDGMIVFLPMIFLKTWFIQITY